MKNIIILLLYVAICIPCSAQNWAAHAKKTTTATKSTQIKKSVPKTKSGIKTKKTNVNNDSNKNITSDSHEFVDLGLPSGTLWATCNVGANSPEDYGLYFAWGETKGYTGDTSDGRSFDWASYKWCNGSHETITKYCTNSEYGTVDNKKELDSEDDAATVNWGKDWCIPSLDQIKELYNSSYTTTTWTTKNGVTGRLITSVKNGNSVFLPAAGYRNYSNIFNVGSIGYYWSRSLNTNNSSYAYSLYFNSSYIGWNYNNRDYGRSVRPVRSARQDKVL